MNCQESVGLMDDYADDALAADEQRAVREHLHDCDDCRQRLSALETLTRASRRLPASIEPAADLWPGILERLDQHTGGDRFRRRRVTSRSWGLLAASVLAALALAATVAVWWGETGPSENPKPLALLDEATDMEVRLAAVRARAEDGTMGPRQDLIEAIERQRGRLGPEAVAEIEASAQRIDEAIGEIRRALDDNPDNGALNLMLASTYRREVEFLKRLKRL